MTMKQAAEKFGINEEKLLYYENNGLFDCHKQPDGNVDYCDETMEHISLIELLIKAGLDMDSLKKYLDGFGEDKGHDEAQLKVLIAQRYALLNDIHNKEKTLHRLDYLIHEAKKEKKE